MSFIILYSWYYLEYIYFTPGKIDLKTAIDHLATIDHKIIVDYCIIISRKTRNKIS